jgi:fluoride exporter
MQRFLFIGVGGALGTWTRYLVGLWAGSALGAAFPFGTLLVNLSGSFLIAVVMQVSTATVLVSPTLRLALTTGFMGGLTTYSSFNYETTRLMQDGAWGSATLNFALTTGGCLLAGILGLLAGHKLTGF